MKPTSVMLYGPSSSTKTTQLYFMAKWLWEKQGLRTRLIASDPGGYEPFVDSGLINNGIVEVFDFTNRVNVLSDFRKLANGFWPRRTKDGSEYFKADENCKTSDETWSQIGMVCIDSMYQCGEILKAHCVNRPGNTVGFKEAWVYEEEGEVIKGAQMGHYGIVQDEVMRMHRTGFLNLPVKFLIWTSMLGKAEDKLITKEMIYGPQLVGSAATPNIPSWFMHCLHLDDAILPKTWVDENKVRQISDTEVVKGKVAWFESHQDANTGMRYICKTRVLPEKIETLRKVFPFGCVPLGFKRGIDVYFEVMEKLKGMEEKKDEKQTTSTV